MAQIGSKIHIIIDLLTKEIVDVTDTFAECQEKLTQLPEGQYRIITWIYTNGLRWSFSEDSDYLIQNGLVYKQKYAVLDSYNYVD